MNATDIIFTNHAREKIQERGISKSQVIDTLINPTRKFQGKKKDTVQYEKQIENFTVTAIGKQNEKREWIILSVWRDPPLPGTADARQKENWKKMQKAGFWGKIYLTIKQQLGI